MSYKICRCTMKDMEDLCDFYQKLQLPCTLLVMQQAMRKILENGSDVMLLLKKDGCILAYLHAVPYCTLSNTSVLAVVEYLTLAEATIPEAVLEQFYQALKEIARKWDMDQIKLENDEIVYARNKKT